ncbi:hypothetical protein KCV07_g2339, partial [Aureobasidium melanogenum]
MFLGENSKKHGIQSPAVQCVPPLAIRGGRKSTLVTLDTEFDIETSSPGGKVVGIPSEETSSTNANLLRLAEAWSIDLTSDLYRISPKDGVPTYRTGTDEGVVTIMLNERRTTDPEYKARKEISKLVRSKAKLAEFSDEELNRALVAVVNDNGPLGVVDCLLNMGASVDVSTRASTNMWKKVTKKDQKDRRGDVLQTACGYENLQLIELLAAWADRSTLNDSLSIAIVQNAPKKIEILLRSGADPIGAHNEFLNAVRMNQVATVVTVLSGPKNPCGRCKAMALIEAVQMGSTGLINNLIASGADASFEEARALSLAISRFDLGATVTVISGLVPPTANQLDRAAAEAYSLASSCEPNLRLKLIEACLCAGAEGAMTELALQDAVDSLNDEIVRLFLQYNVSVDADDGEALNLAVQKESDDIFDIVLAQSTSSNTWSNALISTPFAKERGQKFALDLLRKGASVDHRDGEPLVAAIDANHLDILRMFLAQSPAETSLSAALLTCVDLDDMRLQTLSILLPQGLCQQALDDGLIALVMDHEPDYNAIRQLLHFRASPAASNGFSLLHAVRRRDLSLVRLLGSSMSDGAEVFSSTAIGLIDEENWHRGGMEILRYLMDRGANPDVLEIALVERSAVYDFATVSFLSQWISSPKSYSLAFADIIYLGDDCLRTQHFELVRLLLAKGASGSAVDYALIRVLDGFLEGNVQEKLLDALLDVLLDYGADVDSFQGLALYLAVGAGQPDVLRKLVKYGASREVMSKCICDAVLCRHREQLAIDLVDVLAEDIRLVNINHKCEDEANKTPLYLAIDEYPRSCRLLRRICELGGAIEHKIAFDFSRDPPKDAIGLPEPLRRAESERREHERSLQRAMDVHLQRLENDRQLKERDLSYRELGQAQYVRHQEQNQALSLEHQGQRFQQELNFGWLRHEHQRYQQQLAYEQGQAQQAQTAYEEHLETNRRHHEEIKQRIELEQVAQRERHAQLYDNQMSHKMEENQRERRGKHREQLFEIDEEERHGKARERASQRNHVQRMNKLQEMSNQAQRQHQAKMQQAREDRSQRQHQMSLGYVTNMNEIA